jgi:hypothetical protein
VFLRSSLPAVRAAVVLALRRTLAALVLLGCGVANVAVLDYREHTGKLSPDSPAYATSLAGRPLLQPSDFLYARPWWTIPVAIAVGLFGLALAATVYRPPRRMVVPPFSARGRLPAAG